MGRRSLPKIDPKIDYSRHYFEREQLPEKFDLTPIFARPELPLEIEVGSGKGLFMNSASRAYPEHNFLGIEIAEKYSRFAAARLGKEQRTNAVMIHGNAELIFAKWVPDASLAAVHVYFPDPWWKFKHHKRRIMNPVFVKQIERTLKPGGTLHFWTDVEEYYHRALGVLAANTTLDGPIAVPELAPEHDLDYRTHFERRMRLSEMAVWRAEFKKI